MTEKLALKLGDLLDNPVLLGHGHLVPSLGSMDTGHQLHEDPLISDIIVLAVVEGDNLGDGNMGHAADPAQGRDFTPCFVFGVNGQRHAEQKLATRALAQIVFAEGASA